MDESEPPRGEGGKGLLPESIKKALVTGISAAFMTEEAIRGALADMRLPKEAISYLVQQTNNSRKELFRVISEELKNFLKSADLAGEVKKALSGMKLEVKAEIRFVDEGKSKLGVRVKSEEAEASDEGEVKKRRR